MMNGDTFVRANRLPTADTDRCCNYDGLHKIKIDQVKRAQSGFTLIELMIVVAIIGIMLSLAISQYSAYLVRAQVSESLSLMAAMKTTAGEYYNQTGSYPANNSVAGLTAPATIVGNYITEVDINGTPSNIRATFGHNANIVISGHQIRLSAIISGQGIVRYQCKAPTIDAQYLPSVCR